MRILSVLFLTILVTSTLYPQLNRYPRPNEGNITGGLGLNWIDGELNYTFHFTPEISFANFGFGLDLQLDFDKDGNLRKENFNEFSDYLSVIRYARYGLKNDPVFVKLGAIDYYTLGHGSIMYAYNNSVSLDARKTGLVLDIDFGTFGFESIYSRFSEAGVAGIRGYVRPLQLTEARSIPVISNLEIGATFAGDFDDKAGILNGIYNPAISDFTTVTDEGSVNIIGFDIGLPVISSGPLGIDLYMDYAKILDFGSGISAGALFQFNGLGMVTAQARLERRFNQEQYIPSYFNALYELERFQTDTSGYARTKLQQLVTMGNGDNGYYGELGVNVLGLFDILGSYQRLDKTPNSGYLHISTEIAPEEAPFLVRAGYDKVGIGSETDLFKLDDRSYLFFELGYKPVEYIVVSMVYSWTYTPVRDADDNVIDFQPQKRIEPRVYFVYPFTFGGGR